MAASGHRRHPATWPKRLAGHLSSTLWRANGDLMRDPEMLFELAKRGDEIELTPYYWRNDYVGVEEYSAIEQEDHWLVFTDLKRRHSEFARTWDANLRAQGYLEAFLKQREP